MKDNNGVFDEMGFFCFREKFCWGIKDVLLFDYWCQYIELQYGSLELKIALLLSCWCS